MPHLIEIAFKGNRREFFLWSNDEAPPRNAAVIVDADRGEDFGHVHAFADAAEHRSAKVPHGLFGAPPSREVKRLASTEDTIRHDEVRASDDDARRKAMERVRANALVMKMTDAEWQWDRKKLTFYFTAEKRVDFRTLVRELASMFRTRIELKQIGVRDEAKRLDGIGRCGRQYCSASWLPELRPVNLGVAKDQRLSLNPSQISGACGRLMCCLRYEHDFYVASRRKYPKETKIIRTSRGEEKVIANDIFRERVTLRGVEGDARTITLSELLEEMTAAGDPLATMLASAASALPGAHHHVLEAHDDSGESDAAFTDEHPVAYSARQTRDADTPRSAGSARDAQRDVKPAPRAPLPISAPVAPSAESVDPEEPEDAATAEQRTQRRRGRRGGRRNRGGHHPGDGVPGPAQPS